jgi:hypothetical protein
MNKALRQRWVDAGYSSVMGSAEVVGPPSPNFIRVDHLTSAEYAISNIGLGRLKVARFSDLNDPFELLALSFKDRDIRKIVTDFKNENDGKTGLLCFSANWTNPVLWSHYGAKHRGICLGFNLRKTLVEKIQYEQKRISIGKGSLRSLNDAVKKQLLCTKFSHWEYESEYRAFIPLADAIKEAGLYFWKFDLPLNFHPAAVRASANVTPFGAVSVPA